MNWFIIYELTSKKSYEGKLKAELKAMNERTSHVTDHNKPCDRPQDERPKAANERTDKITYERMNKPNNRTSETPAEQRESGPMVRSNARKPDIPTNG